MFLYLIFRNFINAYEKFLNKEKENSVNIFNTQNVNAFFISIKIYLKKKNIIRTERTEEKCYPGEKKERKFFFMCPLFIIIVLLVQQPPHIGKIDWAHVLFLVLYLLFLV